MQPLVLAHPVTVVPAVEPVGEWMAFLPMCPIPCPRIALE
jgi:hypothetical protein